MDQLSPTLASGFSRYFEAFASRTRALVDDLSDDEFWTKPYPYGNSVGHLLLHVTGNLSYYIGARMANTGYVRDRDREFTDTSRRSREVVLADLERAVAVVVRTIKSQRDEDWVRTYEAAGVDDNTRFSIVLRCAQHFHHHLGQIIYLVNEHKRQRASGLAGGDPTAAPTIEY